MTISHTSLGIVTLTFFSGADALIVVAADALIVVAAEIIAVAATPIIVLRSMVLIPLSGHAPQPSTMKLNSSYTVARVRRYRAVYPEHRAPHDHALFRAGR